MSESSGDTRAINRANSDGSVDYGLFQVSLKHSRLLGTLNCKLESSSEIGVKSSFFCVVINGTLDACSSSVQRILETVKQIKETETF
jgi:hypothetical protein